MTTVVFADLVGSTELFQRLGDETASVFVSGLVGSLSQVFQRHHGHVVKLLGDGLFVVFPQEVDALAACVAVQNGLLERPVRVGDDGAPVQLRIGMESGEVVEIAGDVFGDTVNSAARLADLAGAAQILTTHKVRSALPPVLRDGLRSLGALHLRGREEAVQVYRVDWQHDTDEDATAMGRSSHAHNVLHQVLTLMAGTQVRQVHAGNPVLRIGRGADADLVLNDPRVSRAHASVEFRGGQFVLLDTSTYGTWVYLGNQQDAVVLRRTECFLVGSGQVSAGGERKPGSPLVEFTVGS